MNVAGRVITRWVNAVGAKLRFEQIEERNTHQTPRAFVGFSFDAADLV